MYRIIKMDGSELAVVAKAMWVKIGPSGSLAPAKNRGDAVGIAYQSVAYNLLGFDRIPDAETVMVADLDAGKLISPDLLDLSVDHEYRLTMLELGLTDL